ncbi:MAG: hypothetical protein ACSW8F_01140 [bacterium]
MKKKLLIGIALVALIAVTAAVTAVAVGNYGSQSDPLVTLSYLDETVLPVLREEIAGQVEEKAAALTEEFEAKLTEEARNAGVSDAERFQVVTLTRGQVLRCKVGTELMLRVGSAASAGPDAPRLVDETTGTDVTAEGTVLEKNHMYLVTIVQNGLKATADTTKVLVRGEYTLA